MFFYPYNYFNQRNTQAVSQAVEKLKNKTLPVENILDEDELMNDLKYSNNSQLVNHLSKDHMIGLLKYIVREPEKDEHKIAYKFPFNAAEILSSENSYLLDKFFEDTNSADEDKYEELEEEEVLVEENKQVNVQQEVSSSSNSGNNQNKEESEDADNLEIEEDIQISNGEVRSKEEEDSNNNVVRTDQKVEEKKSEDEVNNTTESKEAKETNNDSADQSDVVIERAAHEENKEANVERQQKEDRMEVDDDDNNQNNYNNSQPSSSESPNSLEDDIENLIKEETSKLKNNSKKTASQEKVYTPQYEVFDYFLSFLDTEGELNYVLCGYFAKIFTTLKFNRPAAIARYLYVFKREYINKLVNHLNRKALSDTLLKILLIEASDVASDITTDYEVEVKYDLVHRIIESFDERDEEKSLNICDLFSELLNNRKFSLVLLKNSDLVSKLHSFVLRNVNSVHFKELLKISTKLLDFIIKEIRLKINKDAGVEQNAINIQDIYENRFGVDFEEVPQSKPADTFDLKDCVYLLDILSTDVDIILRDYVGMSESNGNNNFLKMNSTFDKQVAVFGTRRLLEFEYVRSLYEIFTLALTNRVFEKEVPSEQQENRDANITEGKTSSNTHRAYLNLVDNIIDNKFMIKSIEDFFTYEWNNSFQSQFENFITMIINFSYSASLIEEIFTKANFLDKIIDLSLGQRFTFNSGKFINNGYFPFLMEICNSINNSKNEILILIVNSNPRWNNFYSNFVEPVRKRFSTGLRYESQLDPNLFKEDFAREIFNENKPTESFEFTEKNFIESVRKQANMTINTTSAEDETENRDVFEQENVENVENVESIAEETTSTNGNQNTSSEERYSDNNYWNRNNVSLNNLKEMEEILSELEL